MIADASFPSLSLAATSVIVPILIPLIVKFLTVPLLTALTPVVTTDQLARTPKRSDCLFIASVKTPKPVPTLVEISTSSIPISLCPSTAINFIEVICDAVICTPVSYRVLPILSLDVGAIEALTV